MRTLYKLKFNGLPKIVLAFMCTAVVAAFLAGCAERDAGTAFAPNADERPAEPVDYVYGIPIDENAGVVKVAAADVYSKPDVKSARITQALYNQPVGISRIEGGWAEVKTVDGYSGWMKSKHIDRDISSIHGRTFTHRIIVTSKEKTIYSGPSGGVTVAVAPMGAEFYAFNSYDDAYEVFLPGNKTGWLKGSGIIHIGLDEMIPATNAEDFAATALRMKGVCYLENGISPMGIDSAGLVHICARINGINLPRTLKGQFACGTEIKPEDAVAGDLVFLAGTGEGEKEGISCVGICLGNGIYVYAGRKTGYVAIGEIMKENDDGIVVAARRIFNAPAGAPGKTSTD